MIFMTDYCVISHTHWDREWYQTQEEFRMRLIDLFDHLLEILDKNPKYIFHMDAQTIVFEDYWEVRPEMKEKCCRYIREGRIQTGPWYVQNDFFLTSGEATVRNLLLGMKQADEMGGCAMTGYAPDQFGLISQLPQILRGFGLDHCLFGRGYMGIGKTQDGTITGIKKPSEFLWKSPDGSEVLAICMTHWYNNAQRFSADIDKAYRLTQTIQESFEGVATTPYLLLMNGVDHLEPQGDLLSILADVQSKLPEDENIYQTSMEHYVELIREATSGTKMHTEVGELMQGLDQNLLKDTASSRAYLKIWNSELQNLLENQLEPLYTLLELAGMKGVYPSGHMDYLWKMLIRNHAHDSICGCSTDAVHRHMEDRFGQIQEMGRELFRRGMKQLATHVRDGFHEDDYQIVVFNGLEHARTEMIDVTVDIIASDNPKGIRIISPNGKEVPFLIQEHYTLGKSVFSAINLPGNVETERYVIRMLAEDVPAFGYTVYRVEINQETTQYSLKNPIGTLTEQNYCLENDFLKATILPSGRIELLHKESEHCYSDILSVQDVADIGNAYVFKPLEGDVPVDIADSSPQIILEESDAFVGRVRMHYDIALPKCYDAINQRRSDEKIIMPLDVIVSLKKGAEALEVRFEVENRVKDHRLRVLVRTGLHSDMATVTTPYDVISRNKWDIDKRICNETEHTSGMVVIKEDDNGVAVLNRGIYGYEHLQGEQGTLAFTVVRATGTISAGVESDDDAWRIPENQCLRKMHCEIAIMPQVKGGLVAEAVFASKAFQNPLVAQCEPVNTRKFLGGRTAVQDTSIAELFYQDIPYADVELTLNGLDMTLDGEGIQVTAFKKAFDREGYILRFYNTKETETDVKLRLGKISVSKVWKTNLRETIREELPILERDVCLQVKGKEIVTLYMK